MRGLIIKDFLYLKNTWKNLVIIFIGSLLISIALGNFLLAICALPLTLLASTINTFQTDEFFNTESYTLSLPLSRIKIVTARFLYTILMLFISFFIGLVLYYLIRFTIRPGRNGLNTDMLKYLIMLESASLLVDSIFYPIIYKVGCEKSRLVLLSIVMLLLGIGSILSVYVNVFDNDFIDFVSIINFIQNNGVMVLGIIVTITTIISYFLSILFYRHRDF
ncbi:MAG: ABC-2 transporter permease [Erysipelotrichales bacterium]|nr:ABC-2 transporter permease [Erysipelotrichales bacterium]